jgi:hypothetical protein
MLQSVTTTMRFAEPQALYTAVRQSEPCAKSILADGRSSCNGHGDLFCCQSGVRNWLMRATPTDFGHNKCLLLGHGPKPARCG